MKKIHIILMLALPFGATLACAQSQMLKLEEIWADQKFVPTTLNEIRTLKDGESTAELITKNGRQYIVKNDIRSGRTTDTLFRSAELDAGNEKTAISKYALSHDNKRLLITTREESIYRHSTRANYIVYEVESGAWKPLSEGGKQQYATFSPDDNAVAFVRDNNLFIKNLVTQQEVQVTSDGVKNQVINGATDWVYEEEFSFETGFQWSPDGKYIAFYRFDESAVKEYTLTMYGELYPKEEKYKYPKAGEANSNVEIRIYDVKNGKTVLTDVNKEADQYIPRIQWMGQPGKLCVMRMNRLQNHLELYACDAVSGLSTKFFEETNAAYIDVTDDLRFLSNSNQFIWTSTLDGYNHVYLYQTDGKLVKQLTRGNWDVTDFYGINETTGTIFYQAAKNGPTEKQVFATTIKGETKMIGPATGTSKIQMSADFRYGYLTHSSIDSPYDVGLYEANGKLVRMLIDNAGLKQTMNFYQLTKPEFFTFTTTEGVVLNGWMIKPAGFSEAVKYPVLQYMYGGPNSQTVKNEWIGPNYFWFQLMAQKGYIVVSVDNRGTGARGEAFHKCVYKQLGHLETIDQIETAKWLSKQRYVDSNRIGCWGWSFGGYMTSMLITKGADYFKAAVAVAPVTNWKYYDTIYTERYLQTPQENEPGYESNSPINYASLLRGKFLLVHGMADDNVHMQNSVDFTTALVEADKQFESFYYPNKAHGITGVRLNLYTKITQFLLRNL